MSSLSQKNVSMQVHSKGSHFNECRVTAQLIIKDTEVAEESGWGVKCRTVRPEFECGLLCVIWVNASVM